MAIKTMCVSVYKVGVAYDVDSWQKMIWLVPAQLATALLSSSVFRVCLLPN